MEVRTSGRSIDCLIERVLCMNIPSSDYFKELYKLKTYHEVVDEIYEQVDHVEPWMTGNCRGPSTAFCLLYKFFTMKLTVKQMHGLLKHPDSPYIRAVGFLFLRFAADSKTLWNWFEPYIKDDEELSTADVGGKARLSGARNIQLTGVCTLLVPLNLDKSCTSDLLISLSVKKPNNARVYSKCFQRGLCTRPSSWPVLLRQSVPIMRQIIADLEKMKLPTKQSGGTGDSSHQDSRHVSHRPPSVKASLFVSFGQRAPHRASTHDSSPVRRTFLPPRDYNRDRDHNRDRSYNSNKDHSRDSRGRDSRDSRRRDYERGVRDSDRRRDSSSRRSRSRSRSRSPEHRRSPFRDENRDGVSKTSSNLAKLKDMYGDTGSKKGDTGNNKIRNDSSSEEVIRLGGSSWK